MSIKVKGLFEDIGGAGRVTELRRKKLANASSRPDPRDPIRELADRLHPAEMKFRCVSVTDASPSAKTFRFESVDGHIPVFQCGQFVNFRLRIGESLLTRPYTISSAPYEARGEKPFFEITVRRNVPYLVPGYPVGTEKKTFKICVVRGVREDIIEAKASESVAVALERSAIPVDTHCRNGECGFCRSQLLSGDIFVSPIGDGRREMDKEMGWFHACSSYPLSDLKIKIPIM